jgi:nucleoside-diphosphate-sugar epimerase
MTRVYLTGSKGFIGSYLRPYLEWTGDEIVGTCDDETKYYRPPSDTEFVYHMGALVRPGESNHRRGEYLLSNVTSTQNLFEHVLHSCPSAKVILFGSGTQDTLDSWYAYTKAMAELVGDAYAKFDGLKVYRLRLWGVTGVGKTGDVVNDFAEQAFRNGRIKHGDLTGGRDISDVRDVVPVIVDSVRNGPPGVYTIGRGETTQISQIASFFNVPLEPDPARFRQEAAFHCCPSNSVRGRPIEETLKWVRDSYGKARVE